MTSPLCARRATSHEGVVYSHGLEHVRVRPIMYTGSLGEEGLHVLVETILVVGTSDSLAGACSLIEVELLADGGCRIRDRGRGIPVHPVQPTERRYLELAFTEFGVRAGIEYPLWVGGLHGMGVCIVNALSSRLIVETGHDGQRWRQQYARGEVVSPVEMHGPSTTPGTVITFWPDPTIFPDSPAFSFDRLGERLHDLAICCAGLTVRLIDHRRQPANEWTFTAPRGLIELLETQCEGSQPLHTGTIHGKANLSGGEIEVAFRWVAADDEGRFIGFVNCQRLDAGTHRSGLRDGIARLLRTRPIPVQSGSSRTSVRRGLRATVLVLLEQPQFQSARRDALNNIEVADAVATLTTELLTAFLRDRPDEADAILDHIL